MPKIDNSNPSGPTGVRNLRKIGTFRQLLVAPPALRTLLKLITQSQDITQLPFVANTALRNPLRWIFALHGGERRTVHCRASIHLDATLAVRAAVCAGAGLSVLPDFAIADDLAAGRLIQVLPHWTLPSGGIHAVFPTTRFRPAKVRAFVELLSTREQQRTLG